MPMTISGIRLSLVVALGALGAAPNMPARQVLSAQTRTATFVIANVRVFDGERSHPGMNVTVENGIIRAVESAVDQARNLPTVDGAGATLLPGLIDAHVHPERAAALQDSLRFGVTTVLGMGVTTTADEAAVRGAVATRVDVSDYR